MAFFTLAALLATFTSRAWKDAGARIPEGPGASLRAFALGTTLLVYLQILVGALVRHTGAGLAFRDFPLMNGTLFPAIPSYLEAFQLAHRLLALLVLAAVGVLASRVRRRHPGERRIRALAVLASILLAVQILLGGASVWTGLAPAVTVAHHAMGALLLATLATLTAWCFRRLAPRAAPARTELPAGTRRMGEARA
jgi:heme A synthase